MGVLRNTIKHLFKVTHTLFILDKINFYIAYIKNYYSNKKFKKENPFFRVPPDYFLYETYTLNYKQYKESGITSAKEIYEWTSKYLPKNIIVLEWGCGVARVIRHLSNYINTASKLFACDINNDMINWNKTNIENVKFNFISYIPPTNYLNETFDLIYALSVFTHIENQQQQNWANEIARILKPGGIFLFTTHGKKYFNKLDNKSLKLLEKNGAYTISYKQKGHRMMSTYNKYEAFIKLIEPKFVILEYYDGLNIDKVGGQDLWIVQKR